MREIKFRAWSRFDQKMFSAKKIAGQPWNVLGSMTNQNGDWKFMQYTGLKDKNGKEIFEGDILESLDKRLSVIEYDAPHFIVRHIPENGSDFPASKNSFKIIGNIYEHPHLLEG